ncbi:MAG TPA: glycosyltransferase, partial [Pseudolabrys sp.]|nr:glycosyltransferase [Pseudolabrys sp.]
AQYALLRPEFAELRKASLARRDGALARLLVFMGGGDAGNETCKALRGVALSGRTPATTDVVIGSSNPHRQQVERACAALPGARLHVQTERMAELMAAADCAVGAAGTTTWERCALGLPALVVALADNQIEIAQTIDAAGAHRFLGWGEQLTEADYARALDALDAPALAAMSRAGAQICDGLGAERVAARLAGAAGARARAGSGTHG